MRDDTEAPVELAYSIDNQKWVNANKKCLAFVKNTIENAIVGSMKSVPLLVSTLQR